MSARIEIRTDQGTLDLIQGAETEFYITRQVFDLNDFETRNADFTKSLRIPTTPNNVKILNAIADTSGTTGEETNKIRCSILMDGITIAPVAWILVFKTTFDGVDQFFQATIFYGNFNMFDELSGETIDKINWADTATDWETTEIITISQYTYLDNNITWAACDWFTRDSGQWSDDLSININTTGFFIYARTIIERMLLEAGYTLVVGTVPADFNTIALACPVTKFIEATEVGEISLSATVINTALQTVVGVTERAIYQVEQTGSIWDIGTNQFTIGQNLTNVTVKAFGTFDYIRGHPNNPPSRIVVFQNAVEIAVFSQAVTAVGVAFSITTQVNAVVGDIFYVELQSDNTNAPATISFDFDNRFQLFTEGADVSRLVQPSEHIPQIVQSTFLANIIKLFNLIMVTDDIAKTVTLNSFDTIFTNIEVDLSNEIAGGREAVEIDHYLGSLGQDSILTWQNDDLLRRDYSYTEQFENEILNKEATVLSMDFSACDDSLLLYDAGINTFRKAKVPMTSFEDENVTSGNNLNTNGNLFAMQVAVPFQVGDFLIIDGIYYRITVKNSDITGAILNNFATNDTFIAWTLRDVRANDFENRLAILRIDGGEASQRINQDSSVGPGVTLVVGSHTANFMDSLLMATVAATYYDKIFASLQQPQVIRAKFNLSVLGVANFDFLKPVYLSSYNAFYYVNKIEQFKVDSLTRMELIRITEGVPKADPIPPPPATQWNAHIIQALKQVGATTYNLSINAGNPVEPVGFATFEDSDTAHFRLTSNTVIGGGISIRMQVRNDGDDVLIGDFLYATTNVLQEESLIMNVANTPLWDGGAITYQAVYFEI